MNILLQILDEGKTNDAQGRTISFENAVIIMTSNAGSETKENLMGFGKDANTAGKDKAMKSLQQFLRPEFIGRVDEVILFNSLSLEDYEKIAALLIGDFAPSLQDKGVRLTVSDGVAHYVAKEAVNGIRGARDIRHTIRRLIEDPITNLLVSSYDKSIDEITVSVAEEGVTVTPVYQSN